MTTYITNGNSVKTNAVSVLKLTQTNAYGRQNGAATVTPYITVQAENFPFYLYFSFLDADGLENGTSWKYAIKTEHGQMSFTLNRVDGKLKYRHELFKMEIDEATGDCRKFEPKF